MKRSASTNPRQRGFAVAYVIFIMLLLAMVSTSLFVVVAMNVKAVRQADARQLALNVAEAGIARAIYELAHDPSYSGEARMPFSPGEFSIMVTPRTGARVFSITSTGHVNLGEKDYHRSISAQVDMERQGAQIVGRVIRWTEN